MTETLNKRKRLIAAANQLFLQKGFNMTTLGDIANVADVPLGNVYYYFKAKLDIAIAVIELQHKNIIQNLDDFSIEVDPKTRLSKFVKHCLNHEIDDGENLRVLMVGLWHDLNIESGDAFEKLQEAVYPLMTWLTKQFEQLGKGEKSKEYARQLFVYLQGSLLNRKIYSSHDTDTQVKLLENSLGFA